MTKTVDLSKYNGRVYQNNNGRCLRFKSGAFHYVDSKIIKQALASGFKFGYDRRVYTPMPWGLSHTGYEFVELPI